MEPKIDFNFYEQPSTISYFDAIYSQLQTDLASEGADTTFTAPSLAHFTARFQQFQQDALGKAAAAAARQDNTSALPARIPSRFFRVESLSSTSPLYTILKAAYSFQSDKDISDWQFDVPEEKDLYLELVRYIKDRLVQAGQYRVPVICFDAGVDAKKKEELEPLVKALGGMTFSLAFLYTEAHVPSLGNVTDASADATHIVYNDESPEAKEGDQRPYRVLSKNNDKVYVHYQHLPDSYNAWIDANDQQPSPQEDKDDSYPLHVNATWVRDSYTYNEWANPADYSCADKVKAGTKRPVDDTTIDSPAKKSRMPDENSNKPTQQPQQQNGDGQALMEASDDTLELLDKQQQEEAARKYISVQTHEIIIPSYAAWFDMSVINDIERRSLPEFFNSRNRSKTPSVYKEYRDFMVNTYRLNPLEYLTVTACRRNMTGDVCAIIRVHAFLEQWGLINYQVSHYLRTKKKRRSLNPCAPGGP